MIKRLHIENYILINSLDIIFEGGLNTITGETGAGKSIILGAVSLILGGRGDNSLIRNSDKNLVLEGDFLVKNIASILQPIFETEDIEYSDTLTIKRIITPSGRSKSYINDEPVTITFLRQISGYLVDIHSQHQTLLLSNSRFQTHLMDLFSGGLLQVTNYSNLYNNILKKRQEIALLSDESEKARRDLDYILFQLNQLSEANLKEGEEEELEHERDLLANASLIGETLFSVSTTLSGQELSVITSLQSVNQQIGRIGDFLSKSDNIEERLLSVLEELKDINREIEIVGASVEDNPQRLSEVEERLDTIHTLEHKHGVQSVAELIALRDELQSKSELIESSDEHIAAQKRELEQLEDMAWSEAHEIHSLRASKSELLSEKIVTYLQSLGIPSARFAIEINILDRLTETGADEIKFLFSANSGSKLEPIDKVASGGEMSRLMLSLKAIASADGTLPTVIFDEIDTGVSGKVADMMGNLISELSNNIQIINITHLPQIASKGEHHYYIYKEQSGEESYSKIVKLSPAERVQEIAVMISGDMVTDAAIKQAKLLLKK